MNESKKDIFFDIFLIIAGSLLYACSVTFFSAPNNIAPGGITGAATLVNFMFSALPIGTVSIILNIPVFIFGAKKIGKTFFVKSLIATLLVSVLIDILDRAFSYAYTDDRLLAALCAGILSGGGLALVFMRGGSTGGTDIIAKVVHKTAPHFSMGKIILAVDALIILLSIFVYKDLSSAIYAAVLIFVQTKVIDSVLNGMDVGRLVYAVSDKYGEISSAVIKEMCRGVTLIDATGAYSNDKKKMLMCAVRRNEVTKIQKIIKNIDGSAFIIVCEAGEILGQGFKKIENNQ